MKSSEDPPGTSSESLLIVSFGMSSDVLKNGIPEVTIGGIPERITGKNPLPLVKLLEEFHKKSFEELHKELLLKLHKERLE